MIANLSQTGKGGAAAQASRDPISVGFHGRNSRRLGAGKVFSLLLLFFTSPKIFPSSSFSINHHHILSHLLSFL